MDWQGAPASPSSYTVKRILRLEIPVDAYPNVSPFLLYYTCSDTWSKIHAFDYSMEQL